MARAHDGHIHPSRQGLTSHLLPLAAGFKQSRFRPQGREGAKGKLDGFCSVIEEALMIVNKDLDRLISPAS
jgi:hypothetical protein